MMKTIALAALMLAVFAVLFYFAVAPQKACEFGPCMSVPLK